MPITDWPAQDRPREKLLTRGEQALTDSELLAIFLKTGSRGQTALDIAKSLLTQHGSLKKLLRLPPHEILQQSGIGPAKYAALRAALELGKRCLSVQLTAGVLLNHSSAARQFLSDKLREHASEVFACLFLDNHLRLISFEELFLGTINEANIYPREIVRRGLSHNAAKIILAHNHPSGETTPSAADKEVTQLIRAALKLVDIQVVDHVIVGNPGVFSFAEAGLLTNP